ncbi:hypothetical protein [Butyrivibrio sp. INlla16]|uniref:hypothetical protein n=1 Tax=Butyrivibrio sp. INlla16 TaxID=1520807 RepID=UPI00088A08AE|nr:hypothetical protein [Butyrivibrio sp. INlla16]SDB49785.1 hypothetical protein SAMN02910263_02469 [Butyrivibrio sp. INlla16]
MKLDRLIERRDKNRAEIARLRELDRKYSESVENAQDAEMVKVIHQHKISMQELKNLISGKMTAEEKAEEIRSQEQTTPLVQDKKNKNFWEDTDEDN